MAENAYQSIEHPWASEGAQGPQTLAAGAEHRASHFLPIFSLGTSQI